MAVSVEMNDSSAVRSDGVSGGTEQLTAVLRIRDGDTSDAAVRAASELNKSPDVHRVLVDEASQTLVVRSRLKASALRSMLAGLELPAHVVTRANSSRGGAFVDQTLLAFLILAAQIALSIKDFGLGWPMLPIAQMVASAFVIVVLGAPLLREAIVWARRRSLSMGLALTIGAGSAWMAGLISVLRLQEAGKPYFLVGTLIAACGLLAHSANKSSRAAVSAKLQRMLRLMPERAMVESRGSLRERDTATLRRGQVVQVENGERFPSDGVLLSGEGPVNESTVGGGDRPYRCGPGDAVLGGTLNQGDMRRVRITARPRDAAVALLARVAAESEPAREPWQSRLDRWVLWGYFGVMVFAAAVAVLTWLMGRPMFAALESGLLILAAGAPASLAFAAPVSHSVAAVTLRRWGIWAREPLEMERAGAIKLLLIGASGVVTEGVRRVLRTTVTGGGDERRVLALADAALDGSSFPWTQQVRTAAVRHNAPEHALEQREYEGEDGVIAHVRAGPRTHRIAVGSAAFVESQGVSLNPNFVMTDLPDEPSAEPLFVCVDGHAAGAIWLTDPIRQTACSAVRILRSSGVETCVIGGGSESGLAQIAGTVEADSYVVAENGAQQVAEIRAIQQNGQMVAMVGHPLRDAAGLAAADLSIGFGALNTPAAARPGFLVRDASVLLVAACFGAARTLQRRLRQSAVVAIVPMLVAIALAMLGRLDVWVALILIGVGAGVVLLNSLRMLGWRPGFAAGGR